MKCPAHLLSLSGFALAMLGLPLLTQAQPLDLGLGAAQARSVAERDKADATYLQEEKACYGKFAVNDCLKAAKAKRRETHAALRRHEVSLNDAERRRKAAERLREIDERAAEPTPAPARSVQPQAARAAASAAKDDSRQEQAAGRTQRGQEKQAERAAEKNEKISAAPINRQRHEMRLQEAAERRAKLEKRLADRKKPAAQPLPVQP